MEEGLTGFPGVSAGGRWTASSPFWARLTGRFQWENKWVQTEGKNQLQQQLHRYDRVKQELNNFNSLARAIVRDRSWSKIYKYLLIFQQGEFSSRLTFKALTNTE